MTTIEGPFGATIDGSDTDFRVYSGVADAVELCLFDAGGGEHRHAMAPRAGGVWHCRVDAPAGTGYGFRVHGPNDPPRGLRCNPAKLLVDPYAKAISVQGRWPQPLFAYRLGSDGGERDDSDSAAEAPRGFVVDSRFDWGADRPPRHAPERTVMYELHVKGFTKRLPGVPEMLRGTYAGLAHPAALEAICRLSA
jgi:isoamylase